MVPQAIDFSSNAVRVIGALAQKQEQILAVIPSLVANTILGISDVEYVYVKVHPDGVFHVWTVVDDPQEEVYDAIYDQEQLLIARFQSIQFDFQVISRYGRELRSVISLSCQGWRKRDV